MQTESLLEDIVTVTASFQPYSKGTENVNYRLQINCVDVFSIMSHYEKASVSATSDHNLCDKRN